MFDFNEIYWEKCGFEKIVVFILDLMLNIFVFEFFIFFFDDVSIIFLKIKLVKKNVVKCVRLIIFRVIEKRVMFFYFNKYLN